MRVRLWMDDALTWTFDVLATTRKADASASADAPTPVWILRAAERIHAGRIPGTRGLVAVRPLSFESIAIIIAEEWERGVEEAEAEVTAAVVEARAAVEGGLL